MMKRVGWFVLRLGVVPPLFVIACVGGAIYWIGRLITDAVVFIWTGDP